MLGCPIRGQHTCQRAKTERHGPEVDRRWASPLDTLIRDPPAARQGLVLGRVPTAHGS